MLSYSKVMIAFEKRLQLLQALKPLQMEMEKRS